MSNTDGCCLSHWNIQNNKWQWSVGSHIKKSAESDFESDFASPLFLFIYLVIYLLILHRIYVKNYQNKKAAYFHNSKQLNVYIILYPVSV